MVKVRRLSPNQKVFTRTFYEGLFHILRGENSNYNFKEVKKIVSVCPEIS